MHNLPPKWARLAPVLGAASLLLAHAGLLAWGALVHAPNTDEPAQLAAGVSHWQYGRFELYRVTPPLVRLVGALPVLLADVETDWTAFRDFPGSRAEVKTSYDFCAANGNRIFWLMTLARWACIPFSLLGGWICYLWARQLFGAVAGFVALALWCFSPNILGHGQFITTDVAGAALCVTAAYAFWRWLRRPTWEQMFFAGLALGLAQLTKGTYVVLFVLWPVLWLVDLGLTARCLWGARNGQRAGVGSLSTGPALEPKVRSRKKNIAIELGQLFAMNILGLCVLNVGYGFDETFKPLGRYQFVSAVLGGPLAGEHGWGNRFAGSWLGMIPVPLPEHYVRGLDTQRRYFERKLWSYLRGQWKLGGWWYYYLYGLGVKVPLGTWGLVALAVFRRWRKPTASGSGCRPDEGSRTAPDARLTGNTPSGTDWLVLLGPATVVLVLVSSQTGFNKNVRYAFAVLPFMFIAASSVFAWHRPKRKALGYASAACLGWSIVSSLWYYPHSVSYFNELAGGPSHGPKHLIHTNIDFGQDLLLLRDWLDAHQNGRPLKLAYYGSVDPHLAGIQYELPLPGARSSSSKQAVQAQFLGPQPGLTAISVNYLYGHEFLMHDGQGRRTYPPFRGCYRYFLRFRPVARVGYSIYVYDISLDQANQVRQQIGLPPLPGPDGRSQAQVLPRNRHTRGTHQ